MDLVQYDCVFIKYFINHKVFSVLNRHFWFDQMDHSLSPSEVESQALKNEKLGLGFVYELMVCVYTCLWERGHISAAGNNYDLFWWG